MVLAAQQAVLEAVTRHQHKVAEVIQNTGDTGGSMETLAGEGGNCSYLLIQVSALRCCVVYVSQRM